MRFSEFVRALEALENTASRLQMYELLGGLFDRADDEEIAPASYLLEGRLLPSFEGIETGMGERTTALALANATKCSVEDISEASSRLGDLGLVAEELISRSKRSKLLLVDLYQSLLGIARTTGRGSSEEKQRQVTALLGSGVILCWCCKIRLMGQKHSAIIGAVLTASHQSLNPKSSMAL